MNPLLIPDWGSRKKAAKREVPNFLGVRNEVIRDDAGAGAFITVSVIGIKGIPNGSYKMEYKEGAPLKEYLSRIKMKRAAVYSAVYDQTNPENGRCRMNYVPKEGAIIQIGARDAGTALHLQRTNHDAQRLALNMGRVGRGPAPKVAVKEPGRQPNEPKTVRRDGPAREPSARFPQWEGVPLLVHS